MELDTGVEKLSCVGGMYKRKKTGPKAGFLCCLPEITWREQQQEQQERRQQAQRQEQQRQREQQEREQQLQEREPEQQLQQQEPELLLFCHKQTGTWPTERRAGRYISFLSFLESLSNMLIASVFRG